VMSPHLASPVSREPASSPIAPPVALPPAPPVEGPLAPARPPPPSTPPVTRPPVSVPPVAASIAEPPVPNRPPVPLPPPLPPVDPMPPVPDRTPPLPEVPPVPGLPPAAEPPAPTLVDPPVPLFALPDVPLLPPVPVAPPAAYPTPPLPVVPAVLLPPQLADVAAAANTPTNVASDLRSFQPFVITGLSLRHGSTRAAAYSRPASSNPRASRTTIRDRVISNTDGGGALGLSQNPEDSARSCRGGSAPSSLQAPSESPRGPSLAWQAQSRARAEGGVADAVRKRTAPRRIGHVLAL
jgi:hypothetical protein